MTFSVRRFRTARRLITAYFTFFFVVFRVACDSAGKRFSTSALLSDPTFQWHWGGECEHKSAERSVLPWSEYTSGAPDKSHVQFEKFTFPISSTSDLAVRTFRRTTSWICYATPTSNCARKSLISTKTCSTCSRSLKVRRISGRWVTEALNHCELAERAKKTTR